MVPDLDPPRGFLADLAKVLPLAVRGRPRPRLHPAPFSRKMEDFSVALPGVPVLPGKNSALPRERPLPKVLKHTN